MYLVVLSPLRTLSCLLAILALLSCGQQRPPETTHVEPAQLAPVPTQPDGRPVIAAFGDSLTAGYGVETGFSYPDFLQKDLDRSGYIEASNQIRSVTIGGSIIAGTDASSTGALTFTCEGSDSGMIASLPGAVSGQSRTVPSLRLRDVLMQEEVDLLKLDDDPDTGVRYVYRADDAIFLGGKKVDGGAVAFEAPGPAQLFVSWSEPDMVRLWASGPLKATVDLRQLVGSKSRIALRPNRTPKKAGSAPAVWRIAAPRPNPSRPTTVRYHPAPHTARSTSGCVSDALA